MSRPASSRATAVRRRLQVSGEATSLGSVETLVSTPFDLSVGSPNPAGPSGALEATR